MRYEFIFTTSFPVNICGIHQYDINFFGVSNGMDFIIKWTIDGNTHQWLFANIFDGEFEWYKKDYNVPKDLTEFCIKFTRNYLLLH